MFRQDAENTLKNTISMRNRAIARGEEVFEESTGCPEWPMIMRDAVAVDPMGLTVLSRGWPDPSSGLGKGRHGREWRVRPLDVGFRRQHIHDRTAYFSPKKEIRFIMLV
jgi:hypothetical protein